MNIKNRIEALEDMIGDLANRINKLEEEPKKEYPIITHPFSFYMCLPSYDKAVLYRFMYDIDENGFAHLKGEKEIGKFDD